MKTQTYFWHVIRTKNTVRVSRKTTKFCKDVKNSVASFSKREFAVKQANVTHLK